MTPKLKYLSLKVNAVMSCIIFFTHKNRRTFTALTLKNIRLSE